MFPVSLTVRGSGQRLTWRYCKCVSRESRATFWNLGMKHLDVIDGELAAVPAEERPAAGIIGQNLELVILTLQSPDAEVWTASTATAAAARLGSTQYQEYILLSNGLIQRTPCECTLTDEAISYIDHQLIDQLCVGHNHHGCLFGSSGNSLRPAKLYRACLFPFLLLSHMSRRLAPHEKTCVARSRVTVHFWYMSLFSICVP